jgi:hypothetical protein
MAATAAIIALIMGLLTLSLIPFMTEPKQNGTED